MSELRADTITGSDGTSPVTLTKQITAKSFEIHDNDSTSFVSESFNTSSITDGATGICSPVFINNMNTANYYTNASTGNNNNSHGVCTSIRHGVAATTSTYTYRIANSANEASDRLNTMSACIGDLA